MALFCAILVAGCSGPSTIQAGSFPSMSKTNMHDNGSTDQLLAYAATRDFPENVALTLQASEQLITKNPNRAKRILDAINYDSLPEPLQEQLALLQARIADLSNKNWEVFGWLDQKAILTSNNPDTVATAHALRAKAYNRFSEYPAALDEWISAMPSLSKEQQAEYQKNFWKTLLHVSKTRLASLVSQTTDLNTKGWLELAMLYQPGTELEQQLQGLQHWKEHWIGHPGNAYIPVNFEQLQASSHVKPKKIAVLLPLSGPLEKAGTAIRDGIIAASYDDFSHHIAPPELLIMDTNNRDINQVADQATQQGAELIIGPLSKQNVSYLSSDITAYTPVLALNYLDTLTFNPLLKLYQFGLSAEDEAKMAANRAIIDGHQRAIILIPDTSWGKKTARAFSQRWQEKGGKITAMATFDDTTQFSKLIGQLLEVDKSQERERQLSRLLKENLGFQARRRHDFDMVFIAASAAEARQIKPALSYQFAGNLPVYATSSVFSGKINAARDRDLDGIRIPVMPWYIPQLRTAIERNITAAIPLSRGSYGTLYALGVDAYKLYPKLQQLSNLSGSQIKGLTGWLSIDKNHRVDRELTWQIFRNGRLAPLPIKRPKTRSADALAFNK